jgi:hypothetical protein
MTVACHVELTTLRALIQRANIVADAKHSVLWCLDQLPKLYADFCRTNESRFGDAILRLASAVLNKLAETTLGTGAGRLGDAVVAKLGRLHERLGLAPLALKLAPITASGRKRKAV